MIERWVRTLTSTTRALAARGWALTFSATLVSAVMSGPAIAQEPRASDENPAPDGESDRLTLDNGKVLEGRIVEFAPGEHVIMQLEDGRRPTVSWHMIKAVESKRYRMPSQAARHDGAMDERQTARASSPSPGSASVEDFVVLTTGARAIGTVVAVVPGQYVTIRESSGSLRTIAWSAILEVVAVPPLHDASARPQAPSPSPKPEPANCLTDPRHPTCQQSRWGVSEDRGIRYQEESDCSANPSQERCRQRVSSDAGLDGLSIGYRQESATSVRSPTKGAVSFGLDGSFGAVDNGGVYMLGLGLSLQLLAGATFPGSEGGGWSGVAISPSMDAILITQTTPEDPATSFDSGTADASGELLAVRFGGSLGYQYLNFRKMEQETLKQSGVGIMLGGYVGATGIEYPDPYMPGETTVEWNWGVGPVLRLSFPSYNAGTAEYSAFSFTAMVLPSEESTFVFLGIGGSIGKGL